MKSRNLEWIDEHFEYVVLPLLGDNTKVVNEVSLDAISQGYTDQYVKSFLGNEDLLNKLFFLWAVLKEKARILRKPILLPGRDAYIFAVLGEIDRARIIIRPDISTVTSTFIKEDYTNTLMTDSGFAGTCAKNMGIKDFLLVSCQTRYKQIVRGFLPGNGRMLASNFGTYFEGCPKYWQRAYMKGDPSNVLYYWQKTNNKTEEGKKAYFASNPSAMSITKGSPIEQPPNSPTLVKDAFYMHRWIAYHYTPAAIEMSREAAQEFVKTDVEWLEFLTKRANGEV